VKQIIYRKDVEECAESGWSIGDTAEELDVSYATLYRFLVQENMRYLFRHGNRRLKELKKSNVDTPQRGV
jgi:hypothetical protein